MWWAVGKRERCACNRSLTTHPTFSAEGYYNNEGQPMDDRAKSFGPFPGGPLSYFEFLAKWRSDGKFEGLRFS